MNDAKLEIAKEYEKACVARCYPAVGLLGDATLSGNFLACRVAFCDDRRSEFLRSRWLLNLKGGTP